MEDAVLKRTPLYSEHVALGGHMVDFAGWEMPLHYGSIIEEHMAVRERVGLFDVSHMGELLFRGDGAASGLDRLSTNSLAGREAGTCTYTHHLDGRGMIIDDTIATRISRDEFLTVPNASKTGEILDWVGSRAGCEVEDVSDSVCCLALQGPQAISVAEKVAPEAAGLGSFRGLFTGEGSGNFIERLGAGGMYISRTGYTGEDGFEFFVHSSRGAALWSRLMAEGGSHGISPVGLGARDSLRLEKCYLLSGTDFDGSQTTLETGYNWIIDWNHEFIGREALERQREKGAYPRLTSFLTDGKVIPRHGDAVRGDGARGNVTSGGYSPLLGRAVAMGYLDVPAEAGSRVTISVRGREIGAAVVKPPFVRARKKSGVDA